MEPSSRVLCVLGMHRSGTSCLSGTLEQGGLLLGDVQTHNPANLRGNRESPRITALHDRILLANGCAWDSPPALGRELIWSDEDRAERDAIIASFAREPMWGFKDPRTLLALEGWQEALPEMDFVGIFRHPLAVARSLEARGNMPLERALSLWMVYNRRLLGEWCKQPFPILSFDGGENKFRAQVSELGRRLGWAKDLGGETFFASELRHQRVQDDSALPAEVEAVYAKLRAAALTVGESASPTATLPIVPSLSIILTARGDASALTRTLQSLRAGYQLGVRAEDYEVIVIASAEFEAAVAEFGPTFIRRDAGEAIATARGKQLTFLIDGAGLLSPGLIDLALRCPPRAVLTAPTYGLNEALLAQTGWPHAAGSGDRLFDAAGAPGSLGEYSLVAVGRDLFDEAGRPMADLSLLSGLPGVRWLLAAGEGTFHALAAPVLISWPDQPFELYGPATRAAMRLLGKPSDLPLALGDGTAVDRLKAKNNELRAKIEGLKLKNAELRARGDKWKEKAHRLQTGGDFDRSRSEST